jgi:predicted AAA+ superfamily ATPase
VAPFDSRAATTRSASSSGEPAGGGYPETLGREGRRRQTWFRDYVETTLDRDLRDVSDALKLEAMPRLLRLLAAQSAGLLNYKKMSTRLLILTPKPS